MILEVVRKRDGTVSLGKWVGLIVLCIALFILWEIRQVVLLGFTAVVLASALNSVVRQLTKVRIKRHLAIAIAVLGLFAFATVVSWLIIPPFVAQSQQLLELVPQSVQRIDESVKWLEKQQFQGTSIINSQMVDNITRQLPNLAGKLFENFFSLFSNSLLVVLNILLVLVLTIMFLIEPQKYRQIFIKLFPSFYRRRADAILQQCETALDNWMGGILFNMMVIGVCSGLGLWVLRVKLVLANAIIAGLLEAIPNIGPTLSVIPPMAIALLDSPWKALGVLLFYILIQQLEQYLLVPLVMAKQVSLLPAVTLLSQIIFAYFFGFLGLLLALPLIIVGQIWAKEVLVKDVLDHWTTQQGGFTLRKNES
ncbi:AI-2E family transporter [Lyngbya confervoides]|uniref:AI-2E family transporter n=1 Tax=Lyngbya confervoides BDU141951 TaxID=1574623 RepID=A0ABD4T3D8_9CYAN|nr:AI-2E family transporter [Lyngbya confervoides]MCM1982825.1 AI-2E family transporter [Lyngbya confervoides BDU141951]